MIEQVRAELGLDQPLPIRYLNWIGGVFHGDFGESIFSTNEVAADLAAYFPQKMCIRDSLRCGGKHMGTDFVILPD